LGSLQGMWSLLEGWTALWALYGAYKLLTRPTSPLSLGSLLGVIISAKISWRNTSLFASRVHILNMDLCTLHILYATLISLPFLYFELQYLLRGFKLAYEGYTD